MEPHKQRSESQQESVKAENESIDLLDVSKEGGAKYILVPAQVTTCAPQSQSRVQIESQPLKIKVDTDTDWLAVLVTPLAIAIAAGIFTYFSNRQQIRSSTANYRHTWQVDLRNALVNYVSAAQQILVKAASNNRFPLHQDAESLRTQLLSAQNTIALMLDAEKDYAKKLKKEMLAANKAIFSVPPELDNGHIALNEVIAAGRIAIERAWKDIRRDLHHGAKIELRTGEGQV